MSTPFLRSALKALAAGEFVCQHRFRDEYEALEDPAGREHAEQWLDSIGYRLARLSDDGAYFMAHSVVTTEIRSQVRDELRSIRGRLYPVVGILESIRRSQGRDPRVHPGDILVPTDIAERARASSMLESQIMELRDVPYSRPGDSVHTRVKLMLDELEKHGYVHQTNTTTDAYEITGKVLYLYQLNAYITSNSPQLADEGGKDQIEQPDSQKNLALSEDSAVAAPTGDSP